MKTYEVSSVMYIELLSCNPNDNFEFQLPFWVYKQINMNIYCASVDTSMLAKRGNKHVKSEI